MKLSIGNLQKNYDKQVILNQVSLEIRSAKSIGIIGASGCGKSTLLRVLSGIEKPDAGEIVINGCSPITETNAFQKKIGFVFQKHNLFPHLSIYDNLFLILGKIKKVDKEQARLKIEDVLQTLQSAKIAQKRPNQVSGGQAQRAAIARALVTDPEILFLDEPTAALDPILTKEVLNTVKQLKKMGREIIFVTHEMQFLREFADYIIFMEEGKIVEHGPVEILQNPQTKTLQLFLENS